MLAAMDAELVRLDRDDFDTVATGDARVRVGSFFLRFRLPFCGSSPKEVSLLYVYIDNIYIYI